MTVRRVSPPNTNTGHQFFPSFPGKSYNRRARHPLVRRADIGNEGRKMAQRTCIVTGKTFDDETSGYKWTYEGKWYYFADMGSRNRFMGNPKAFLEAATKAAS